MIEFCIAIDKYFLPFYNPIISAVHTDFHYSFLYHWKDFGFKNTKIGYLLFIIIL